jgi:hypothetical protein
MSAQPTEDTHDDKTEISVLGHTLRAPPHEAREFAEKIGQLEHRAARVAELEREVAQLKLTLGREITRRSRALQSIAQLQAAAERAKLTLDGDEA